MEKALWGYTHDDVIAAVPPHWRKGVREEQGSRWAGAQSEPFLIPLSLYARSLTLAVLMPFHNASGAALTVDSRVCENAPPRIVDGKVYPSTLALHDEL